MLQNRSPSLTDEFHLVVDLEDYSCIAVPWEVWSLALVDTSELVKESVINSHDDSLVAESIMSMLLKRVMNPAGNKVGATRVKTIKISAERPKRRSMKPDETVSLVY